MWKCKRLLTGLNRTVGRKRNAALWIRREDLTIGSGDCLNKRIICSNFQLVVIIRERGDRTVGSGAIRELTACTNKSPLVKARGVQSAAIYLQKTSCTIGSFISFCTTANAIIIV